MDSYEKALAAAKAWRATYAAGHAAYLDCDSSLEIERLDAVMTAAILTFLKECPDLESAARSLAGRTQS